jgi:hypothetical protein
METLSNRILLIASYCLMSINMTVEVVVHPDAKDHVASVTGLAFCVVTLVALLRDMPEFWNIGVTVLNMLIAAVGIYLIAHYVLSHGVALAEAPELLVRVYLIVAVPIVAVCYFIVHIRSRQRAP